MLQLLADSPPLASSLVQLFGVQGHPQSGPAADFSAVGRLDFALFDLSNLPQFGVHHRPLVCIHEIRV